MISSSVSSFSINVRKYFLISAFLHILFLLFFMNSTHFFYKIFNPPKKNLLIKEFVQVDIVGMPKLTIKELKEVSPVVDHHLPTVKKVEEVREVQKKSENNLDSFLSKMSQKKIGTLRDDHNQGKTDSFNRGEKRQRNKLQKLSRLALEGNKLSRGGVVVGENQGFSSDDYEIYLSSIPAQVRPYWKLPSYLKGEELKARLKIRINGKGRVISLDIVESSGVEEFDQRAINAVKNVKIFTVPSSSIREELAIRGVILGFPL